MTLSATQSVSKPPPTWGDASDLSLAVDSFSDAADSLINRHPVVLVSIAVPERHRTGIHVRVTGNQHERHLLCLRITNLFLHALSESSISTRMPSARKRAARDRK